MKLPLAARMQEAGGALAAEAARFSGINTKKMTILAYVLCSTLAALARSPP